MKALLACLTLLLSLAAAATEPAPLQLLAARGGGGDSLATADGYLYLPTGRTVTVWQRDAQGDLYYVGDTRRSPLGNGIHDVQRHGDYLYAAYGSAPVNGLAVYSIADRPSPVLLGQYDEYGSSPYRRATNLALVNGHLYLFDPEEGLFVSPLADPAHPVFSQAAPASYYEGIQVDGNRVYAYARTLGPPWLLRTYDISSPLSGQLIGDAPLDAFNSVNLAFAGRYAYAFGTQVRVIDVADPASPQIVGSMMPAAPGSGVLLDSSHAWLLRGNGVSVLDIANPFAPAQVGDVPLALGGYISPMARLPGEVFATERAQSSVLRLDARQPTAPALAQRITLPVGSGNADIALRGDTALVLDNHFMASHVRDSLDLIGRHSVSPDGQPVYSRSLASDGARAYVSNQGSGISVLDIADPRQPVVLGGWSGDVGRGIAARGNLLFATRRAGGMPYFFELVVLDFSDPAQPQLRASLPFPESSDMQLHGNLLFSGGNINDFSIVDISNPSAPRLVSEWNGCAQNLGVQNIALDRRARTALISCALSAQLLDVRDPANPTLLHTFGEDEVRSPDAVAIHGERAYISSGYFSLQEFDIRNPAAPLAVQQHALGWNNRLRMGGNARLYALGADVTIFSADQLFAADMD
jgi:hypothetical protein